MTERRNRREEDSTEEENRDCEEKTHLSHTQQPHQVNASLFLISGFPFLRKQDDRSRFTGRQQERRRKKKKGEKDRILQPKPKLRGYILVARTDEMFLPACDEDYELGS